MFKNFSPAAIGIHGRQSEIIELTLTYGFQGLDLDIEDLAKRATTQGFEQATRFLTSARLRIGGVDLPVRWRGDDETYAADLHELDQAASFAAKLKVCVYKTEVFPGSDELPFHQNFEQHRKRLSEIAEVLAKHGIRLAVGFQAVVAPREERQFKFIQEANDLTLLLKSVTSDNVGLWLDSWHWYVGGGTPESLKAFGIDRVAYVTLADAPADIDPATLTAKQRVMPSDDGPAQIKEVLTLLKDDGYQGPITLAPDADCFSGLKNDAILRQCSSVLNELWKGGESVNRLSSVGACD